MLERSEQNVLTLRTVSCQALEDTWVENLLRAGLGRETDLDIEGSVGRFRVSLLDGLMDEDRISIIQPRPANPASLSSSFDTFIPNNLFTIIF